MKLDPKIRVVADKVFAVDRQKFLKLAVWIRQAENAGYGVASIVAALTSFLPHAGMINKWWQYLDVAIEKAEPKLTARQYEVEHRERKEAEREAARKLFE